MAIDQTPTLQSLSWVEARDLLRLKPVGLLPIGAIEAHGPHLPLDADVIIADAMAHAGGAMIRRDGIPAVVLPALSYTVSFAGACFTGTTPVSQTAFESYLRDVLTHHAGQGYRAICLCNAHLEPAHVEIVDNVAQQVMRSSGTPIAFPDQRQEPWASRLGEEFVAGSRHAGMYETSIVMAWRPETVRSQQLEELPAVWIDLPAALRGGARDFAEAGASLGYFGDPARATEEHGVDLLRILGTMIHEATLQAIA